MSDRNQEVVDLFSEMVKLATLDEGGPASFRVRAYENALRELEEYRGDLEALSEKELKKIDGIGASTAKKIREYFDSGKIAKLESLRKKYPPEFVELTKISGLGPKSVLVLRDKLGIENIDALRAAIEAQEIRKLDGFGAKKEENIAKALERMGGLGKNRRRSIGEALPLAHSLVARLSAMEQVEKATYCGSLRRFRETIGDIDIVAVASDHSAVMNAFTSFDEVEDVVGKGETKSSVIVKGGLQVDLRVVGASQYGAAILYFTGSKAHNIKLRQRAIARAWTLNEYALAEADGGKVVASETEEAIYEALELDPVAPPMREDHGEVEAAASRTLPTVTDGSDFHGDWLIDVDAAAAATPQAGKLGLDYLVIGASADRVGEISSENSAVRIYRAEVVDLGHSATGCADFAVARVQVGAGGDLTEALIAAANDPAIRAVMGASGRLITEADGASYDVESVATAMAETKTVWIVDAGLDRLDPAASDLRRARDVGVMFALGSGSSVSPFAAISYGPSHCQRGWIDAGSLANRWSAQEVDAWLSN